jgi:alkylation response protein AidB-like acyl-CoA dehydrogenase
MPIDFELTSEQQRVKGIGRELAQDFVTRALRHDEERSAPEENYRALYDAGVYGIALPKELGGLGVGAAGWVAFAEELAQGDASTALAFNMHALATGGISQRPAIPRDVKERVAKLALDGKLMGTSISEPTSSSLLPVSFYSTVQAHRENGGYRLNGRKFFTSMIESCDYCYLYAHPKGNPNPAAAIGLLVDTNKNGIRVTDVWNTMGMRATRSNQVDFEDAFVPDDLVLYATEDFRQSFIMQEANWACGGYTACYLGVGLGIVRWAQKQLSTRKPKGYAQVIGYDPNISRRFGDMVMDMEQARLMVYRAAWQHDTQPFSTETFNWWVRAKYSVGTAIQRTVSNAIAACGLHGLFKDQGLELKLRDASTAPVMPPHSDACAQMIGLLTLGLDPAQAPSLQLEQPPAPAAAPA